MKQQIDRDEYFLRKLELAEKEIDSEKLRRMSLENDFGKISAFPPMDNKNIIEYQLDLNEVLDRAHHLLQGHILTRDKKGNQFWAEASDDRLKIFSDYGVKTLMNILSFYVNRNTLLSNYSEEMINWKMRDFCLRLNNTFLFKYEYIFFYPSPEQLQETYKPLIEKYKLNISQEELYMKCVEWSNKELNDKIKHYPMIFQELVDMVHSTYLRALGGQERTSLRKIINVSQNVAQTNDSFQPQKSFNVFKPSTWSGK